MPKVEVGAKVVADRDPTSHALRGLYSAAIFAARSRTCGVNVDWSPSRYAAENGMSSPNSTMHHAASRCERSLTSCTGAAANGGNGVVEAAEFNGGEECEVGFTKGYEAVETEPEELLQSDLGRA